MITAVDNFNRANADALGNLSGGTYTWSEIAGDWDIVSNQAAAQNAAASDLAVLNPDPSIQDCYVQAYCPAVGQVGVVARCANATTFYLFRQHNVAPDDVQIYKFVAGTPTLLGYYSMSSAAITLRLECEGINPGKLRGYVNGTLRIGPVNGDNALDSGNVGIRDFVDGVIDNFEADDLYPPAAGAVGRMFKSTELGNTLLGGLIHVG